MFQPCSGRRILIKYLFLLLVIIDNLYVVHAIGFPAETDPPLIVNTNAMLPGPVTLQRFEPISRRGLQVRKGNGRIDLGQFPNRYSRNRTPAAALAGLEEPARLFVRE